MRIVDKLDRARLRQLQRLNGTGFLALRTANATTMYAIVHSRETIRFDLFFKKGVDGMEHSNHSAEFLVEDVIKNEHFEPDSADVDYPLWQRYFIFGNQYEAYITHLISKAPDFFQVIYEFESSFNTEGFHKVTHKHSVS